MTELYDPFGYSEANCEGSLFDPHEMARLLAKMQAQPLWVWAEEWQPYQMVMGPNRSAAPIAESGREIIEQAKEEAFLAWCL